MLIQEANAMDIATPAIDAALEKFRQRGVTTSDLSTSGTLTSDHDLSHAHNVTSTSRISAKVSAWLVLAKMPQMYLKISGQERSKSKFEILR